MTAKKVAQLKPENQQQVQAFIEDILQRSKLPGISVAMDVNDQTLKAAAGASDVQINHPMSTEMHFELGCLNKFLTAIIVLELVNEGSIDIEENMSHYLPELEGDNGNEIKVKHLLSHTAGYQGENLDDPDVAQDYSYEEFCHSFNQRSMLFEPGTVFDYSHSSSVILGKIIESCTGKKTSDSIYEMIFKPLKIKVLETKHASSANCIRGHQLDPESLQLMQPFPIEWSNFWGNSLGGPWLNMGDLVKIGKALINKNSTISENSKKLFLSPAVKLPGLFVGTTAEHAFFEFGLGSARFPNGSFGTRSSSPGQCCALRFDIKTGIVIAVGINADATYLRDFTINKLFNAMLPKDAEIIPELLPPPETKIALKDLVGTYEGAKQHSYIVTQEGEGLALKAGHNPAINQNANETLLYLIRDIQGDLKPQNFKTSVSIGFFKGLHEKRFNLMLGASSFARVR